MRFLQSRVIISLKFALIFALILARCKTSVQCEARVGSSCSCLSVSVSHGARAAGSSIKLSYVLHGAGYIDQLLMQQTDFKTCLKLGCDTKIVLFVFLQLLNLV